jgi:hypothetical protein
MNKKVEAYITKQYYLLLSIAKTITKGHELHQELLHEVILQLYDKGDFELKSDDDNSIRFYITAVMRINWNSKTSPFYYKIRREVAKYTDLSTIVEIADEQQEFEKQIIFDILEAEYSELSWFHKSLMDMYLILGSMNKVSKEMEIPLTSVQTYIRQAKTQIRNEVINKLKNL